MKGKFFLLICLVFIVTPAVPHAEERATLGNLGLGARLAYIGFTDPVWAHGEVDDSFYFGLEGYAEITRNLYIGGEIGYVNSEELVDLFLGYTLGHNRQLTYVPLELNLKYSIEAAPNFFLDFGVGVSYAYASSEEELFLFVYESGYSDSDWLWGGQIFVDLTYRIKRFFFGLNWKYQVTETYELAPSVSSALFGSIPEPVEAVVRGLFGINTPTFERFDFDNYRIGMRIGLAF